jgi:hypothetical protein
MQCGRRHLVLIIFIRSVRVLLVWCQYCRAVLQIFEPCEEKSLKLFLVKSTPVIIRISHCDWTWRLKLRPFWIIVKYTEAKTTPEMVSQENKIVRGICANRSEPTATGQQEIIGEIKSDISRCNWNKEPLFSEICCCQQRKKILLNVKVKV